MPVNAGTPTATRVHNIRSLTESTYVVRFDRNGMDFQPGQYVAVGLQGQVDMREYSVYSSPSENFLEILVKEVDGGKVSRGLRRLVAGDPLEVDGPFGFFTVDSAARTRKLLFIATGTGISPFHCFATSYSGIDYTLLHGIRTRTERYEYEVFEPARVITCTSREQIDPDRANDGILYQGRVTNWLRENPVDADTLCYLCGNCDMIYEAFDILKAHGVPPEQLFAEVYY